jgi:O-succinylbenzoate synthase
MQNELPMGGCVKNTTKENMMETLKNISHIEIMMPEKCTFADFRTGVVDIQLREPMKLPFGTFATRPSGIVEIHMISRGKTVVGWGEGATLPQPLFTDDCGDTMVAAIKELCTTLQGKTLSLVAAADQIAKHQFANGHQFPTARMAVEMAIFDAVAKAHDSSVATMLGVPSTLLEVPFGKSLGGGSESEILLCAERAIADGAQKIKLKVTPQSVLIVISVIQQLRKTHQDLEIMVDANGTFDPSQPNDLDGLRQLDELGLLMIEEPVSRVGAIRGITAVALLRQKIPHLKTPLCLDDCLTNLSTTNQALTDGLADIINIKPGRIGSILAAIHLAQHCQMIGKQIMVGGMLEATPGRCMTTTLAALFHSQGFSIPGDLSLAQERLSTDLVAAGQQLPIGRGGGILLPTGPGWGFDEMGEPGNR